MALAFVLIFFVAGMVRDRAIHDLARDDAKQTSMLVFQSLYSAMRKGWSKQEINETIGRLNDVLPDTTSSSIAVRSWRSNSARWRVNAP